MLYPKQMEHELNIEDFQLTDPAIMETITEKIGVVNKAGILIKKLFKK